MRVECLAADLAADSHIAADEKTGGGVILPNQSENTMAPARGSDMACAEQMSSYCQGPGNAIFNVRWTVGLRTARLRAGGTSRPDH